MDKEITKLCKQYRENTKAVVRLGKKLSVKQLKKIAKKQRKLFDEGKISVCESWQNHKALQDIVESRKDSIKQACKNLGIEVIEE